MKVFISVGMTGRNDEDVRNDIERASSIIKATCGNDVEIVHTFDTVGPEDFHKTWYISRAIDTLGQCDKVFFTKDYYHSRGCRIEELVAKEYDVERLYEV